MRRYKKTSCLLNKLCLLEKSWPFINLCLFKKSRWVNTTCLLFVFSWLTACGGSSGNSANSSPLPGSHFSSSTSSVSSASSANSTSSSSPSSISSAVTSASSSSSIVDPPLRVESGLIERESNTECLAPDRPASTLGNYAFQPVAMPTGINNPIYLAQAPRIDDRYYILERPGRVKTFVMGDAAVTQAVDFSSQVTTSGEGGALSMAFHPNFSANRYVYIFLTARREVYGVTANSVSMISVVRRYTVSPDGTRFTNPFDILAPLDSADERFNHNRTNHKGGWIGFSPVDGYLYIVTGDKGESSGSVPLANNFFNPAQDATSLHGKVLRIDVDGGTPYSIPSDNPYANGGGAQEIFASGFRNPWRASFDRLTGDLWVADVGENTREEINQVELGGNYGWPFREGNLDRCNGCSRGAQSLPPLVDLPRADGWIAVIGGYVYRGDAIPELQGRYIFADFSRSGFSTLSFAGNIWQVQSWGGFNRLTRISAATAEEFPATLSATGCFDTADIHTPAAAVVPYDLNSPLWSDGADKKRYFALPDESHITIEPNGQWAFPVGSVLIKTFLLNDMPIETRLLVRHDDGDWGGYSYEWNDAGTDAYLLASGKTKTVGNQIWRYPSRAQCMSCHTASNGNIAAERVLGLETAQINRDFIYPGNLIANQIQTLASVGYFTTDPGSHAALAQMPSPQNSAAPLENRARAYLHTNCANCHQPNGTGRGDMDFRYSVNWTEGGYCDITPGFGSFNIADAGLLKPGAAAQSIIPLRMQLRDAHRMPPLGVTIVDAQGVNVVQTWINSLQACR
jgi:uncharacterized repeat protein (TIGR03806 family)